MNWIKDNAKKRKLNKFYEKYLGETSDRASDESDLTVKSGFKTIPDSYFLEREKTSMDMNDFNLDISSAEGIHKSSILIASDRTYTDEMLGDLLELHRIFADENEEDELSDKMYTMF